MFPYPGSHARSKELFSEASEDGVVLFGTPAGVYCERHAKMQIATLEVYERVHPSDSIQASAIVVSFPYNATVRPELSLRKPFPKAPVNTSE